MKKIIFIFVFVLCLMSCGNNLYLVTAGINYDVCYPDTTITYDSQHTFKVNSKLSGMNGRTQYMDSTELITYINYNYVIYSHSTMGSNYLTMKNKYYNVTANLFSSTAPIRVNSYSFNNIRKIRKNNYNNGDELKFNK